MAERRYKNGWEVLDARSKRQMKKKEMGKAFTQQGVDVGLCKNFRDLF